MMKRLSIETAWAGVMYLPSYSPEFNSIENIWSKIRHFS
ncbi:MAG: transposase [Candidatus Marithrix sp.]